MAFAVYHYLPVTIMVLHKQLSLPAFLHGNMTAAHPPLPTLQISHKQNHTISYNRTYSHRLISARAFSTLRLALLRGWRTPYARGGALATLRVVRALLRRTLARRVLRCRWGHVDWPSRDRFY